MKPRIGFVGLGQMGFPMALNILRKGFPLFVYNRTKEKASPLFAEGAHFAENPKKLAESCDIIVSMVSNDNALEEIVNGSSGILSALQKPLLHISMSTVSPELTNQLEREHQEKNMMFVAAPVSGRPARAEQGTLWIFLAGESKAKKNAVPVLETMSIKVFDLGERPQQASLFKLCNNFMILSHIEALSEASTLLEKEGISIEKASEVWGNSLFDSPLFHSYTSIMCNRNFSDGGFALDLGLKDMRLLQTCADEKQVPMPFLSNMHTKLLISMNMGRAKYDWSAIALLAREQAGLQ